MHLTAKLNDGFHIDTSTACTGKIYDHEGNLRGWVTIDFAIQHRINAEFPLSDLNHREQAACIMRVSEMLDSHFDYADTAEEPYTEITFDV